jgi:hypothetical protein
MDDELGPGGPATAARPASTERRVDRPSADRVTPGQFAGALAVACLLLFVMLALFAVVGLGPLGIWPALAGATSLTARVTKIRRVGVLVALAILSFVIVVGITYAIYIAVYLGTPA